MSPEQYATEALDQATGDSLRELSRGGSRPGAGRKTKSADGEVTRTRQVRMTDQQWEDPKLVTADAMRAWVAKRAPPRGAGAKTAKTVRKVVGAR